MSPPPWMPFYVADYLRDTRGLTTAQHGAYFLLILEYWTKGALPDDNAQLARICCMSTAEWKKTRPILLPFFFDGWKHRRLEREIAKAKSKHSLRQEAGKRGGIARATAKQKPSNAQASSSQPDKKDSDAIASDAGASDPRTILFNRGLEILEKITGKTPNACRAFIGKCLKAASDDAVVVLGLIEEAARNRIADPSAWIAAHLKTRETQNGKAADTVVASAARDAERLKREIAEIKGEGASDHPEYPSHIQRLPRGSV